MATNIIENFTIFEIFNDIGSHDGLKKKLPKLAKMPLITLFFSFTLYKVSLC